MRYVRTEGRAVGRAGGQRSQRGSRKRLRRIRLQGNWSVEFWLFVLVMLVALFVLVPWLIRHPPSHHH
jgi:hypothetical protein